jgi:hypothetical protein
MSDFLSQLADRALALPPMVRPRLQSIYEPPAASVLLNPLEEHVEVPAEQPRAIEPAHEQTLQSHEEQSEAKPASEGIDGRHRSETVDQKPVNERIDRKQARKAVDRKSATPQKREVRPQPLPEQAVLTKGDAPRTAPLPNEPESAGEIETTEPKTRLHRIGRKEDGQLERVPTAAAKQPITPHEEAKARSAESDLEIHTPPTQRESIQPQTFSHESKPRVEKRAARPVVVTVRSAQRPRKEQVAPALPLTLVPREERSRASTPTVHVTIGRVEVRAVMPPISTPMIESPVAPKISLEEYLKARNRASA